MNSDIESITSEICKKVMDEELPKISNKLSDQLSKVANENGMILSNDLVPTIGLVFSNHAINVSTKITVLLLQEIFPEKF